MSWFRVTLLLLAAAVFACREGREPKKIPGGIGTMAVRQTELLADAPPAPIVRNPFEGNAQALADGERLYHWYNCSGCHFNGGGGMGPPLMDDEWIYGSEPQNVLDTILEGRPEGMPSYGGLIPQEQAWQIVAYVRSLGGLKGSEQGPEDERGRGVSEEESGGGGGDGGQS